MVQYNCLLFQSDFGLRSTAEIWLLDTANQPIFIDLKQLDLTHVVPQQSAHYLPQLSYVNCSSIPEYTGVSTTEETKNLKVIQYMLFGQQYLRDMGTWIYSMGCKVFSDSISFYNNVTLGLSRLRVLYLKKKGFC